MLHLAPLIILSLISAFGVIGNLFIIGSICLYKRLRVRGNVLLVNLAIADLITVAYIMPVGLATSQFDQNPFGDVMCQINAFLTMTSCGVSTQTLMLIALERYFHICKMHLYRKVFSPKLIGLYIFIVWVYTMAWTCQGWTGWTQFVYASDAYICIFSAPTGMSYAICLAFFGMIVPMIVLGVSYYKIFSTVVRSRRAISAHRRKKPDADGSVQKDTSRLTRPESEKQAAREYRLILTLFTIVVVFCVCWIPACLVLAITPLHLFPGVVFMISIWMALCNSSMNAFVYGILNKNFRTGYKHLLKHLLCCTLYTGKARCVHCQALLDDKDESSSSNHQSSGAKSSKISVAPYSLSESQATKSIGPDSEVLDTPTPARHGDNKSRPPRLQPIKYEEEPTSGAPTNFRSNNAKSQITSLNDPAQDSLSVVHVRDDSLPPSASSPGATTSDGFFNSSTVGSQSSLIHAKSEVSSMASGGYHNKGMGDGVSVTSSARGVRGQYPPSSSARPRPTSQGRELSMTSVVLETKL